MAVFCDHEHSEGFASQFGRKFHVAVREIDVVLSRLGIGTYEGLTAKPLKKLEDAVTRAVCRGINVIDTAPNYYLGKAEYAVAEALTRLQSDHGVSRSSIFLATKVGNYRHPKEGSQLSAFRRKWSGSHYCFDPDYIEFSINQSIEALSVDALDCVFLHNPEVVLKEHGAHITDLMEEIAPVFETFCNDGKLRYWGISSWNGFTGTRQSVDHLDLLQILNYLKDKGKLQHFRILQSPFGFWNFQSYLIENQRGEREETLSFLEFCAHNNLVFFSNSPLLQGDVLSNAKGIDEFVNNGRHLTAAQKHLEFVRNFSGAQTSLVGMTSPGSLDENMQVYGGCVSDGLFDT